MIDIMVRLLDKLIGIVDIAINGFYKLLDYLIKTVEKVSKKILQLLANLLKLLFYVLPFILMIFIGQLRDWQWMTAIGIIVLALVGILFIRDFLAEFRGTIEQEAEQPLPAVSRRAFITVLMLNILLTGYLFTYFMVGITPEEFVAGYFFDDYRTNSQADVIRETQYLMILQANDQSEKRQLLNAIRSLGELRSNKAAPVLIERLRNFRTLTNAVQDTTNSEIYLIINALANIGGVEACNALVTLEVQSRSSQIKEKARRAANQICG